MIHFLRRNKRTTACGRKAPRTRQDTRKPERVTCKTCKRVIAVWRRACAEMAGD